MRSLKHLPVIIFAVCVLLPLGLFGSVSAAPDAPAAPAAPFAVYLPFTTHSARASNTPPTTTPPTTTPPTTTPPTTTPPTSADGALFFEPDQKTASGSIAADAQGGLHLAYHYYVPENQGPDVVYAYCPPPSSQCVNASGWSRVRVPGPVEEVQLRLTPAGQPRILTARIAGGAYGRVSLAYSYYECNTGCLEAANWRSGVVTSALQSYIPDKRELPRRSFALDQQGFPRFVFTDRGTDVDGQNRYGGYLYACDADCTVATNWTGTRFTHPDPETTYNHESVYAPVLKFTSANQPRILAEFYPIISEPGSRTQISYFACDVGCEDDANWGRVDVTPRGGGPEPAWDLELDAQDRPRAVVYHEDTENERSKRLFYFQCDANCLDASAWQPVNLELDPTIGKGANLELDAQGYPRIAHLANNGALVYSWCNSACVQTTNWLHGVAEKTENLDASDSVVIPTRCAAGVWSNYGVSLALDPEGNPRIAYDATYQAQCQNLPDPDPTKPPTSSFQEAAHLVRVFLSPEP